MGDEDVVGGSSDVLIQACNGEVVALMLNHLPQTTYYTIFADGRQYVPYFGQI